MASSLVPYAAVTVIFLLATATILTMRPGGSSFESVMNRARDIVHGRFVPTSMQVRAQRARDQPRFDLMALSGPRRYPTISEHTGATRGETHLGLMWTMLKPANPRLMYLHQTLTPEEASEMISVAKRYMKRSGVVSQDGVQRDEINQARTSEGTFFQQHDTRNHPINVKLRQRIASAVGLPESHSEATQVLHYTEGKRYIPHMDAFPASYKDILQRAGNRVVTVLTWLNVCPEGGETSFPNAEPASVGVSPHQGDSVMFYDVYYDGSLDYHSTHGGDPPHHGSEKWVAVLWFHERPFQD